MNRTALMLAAALAGCNPEPQPAAASEASADIEVTPAPVASPSETPEATAAPARRSLIAERLVLAEWSRAENRAVCAPVSFTSDGGKGGTPRRANFGGGWAVAFDLADQRSAYGVAGTGTIPADSRSDSDKRTTLINQWPSFRDLPALPQPSYAGYGVEGAQPWRDEDPQSLGTNALAYVRIGGQTYQYNVWSRLGRAHLETLLKNMRVIGRVLR